MKRFKIWFNTISYGYDYDTESQSFERVAAKSWSKVLKYAEVKYPDALVKIERMDDDAYSPSYLEIIMEKHGLMTRAQHQECVRKECAEINKRRHYPI